MLSSYVKHRLKMDIKLYSTSKIFFVTKNGDPAESSKLMMLSYVKVVQLFQKTENVQFISEDCLDNQFVPSNIFVAEYGKVFERLAIVEAMAVTPGTILNSKLSLMEPIFRNLVITASGFSEAEKTEIIKMVTANGGTYSPKFSSKTTDILITEPNQINGDKFKAAVKCRKECLIVSWVKDSVARGYLLPYADYRIFTGQPSNILNSTQLNGDNTLRVESTTLTLSPVNKSPSQVPRHNGILDDIDISRFGIERGCLNGVTICLCGFNASDKYDMQVIIHNMGGIYFDLEVGEKVDYAIVEQPNEAELSTLKSLKNSNIVTVDWLLESIHAKRIADPKDFIYQIQASNSHFTQAVPSPASKQNVEIVNKTNLPNVIEAANEAATVVKMEVIDLDDLEENGESEQSAPKRILKICLSTAVGNSEQLRKQIVELGGTVCVDSTQFNNSCTHFICSKPIQSQKTLSIIASGRWLLCPSYVEDSFKAGSFLNEEEYEWGNPKAKSKLPNELDDKSNKIAIGSHKWRKELQMRSKNENKPVGIFSGFRAIIHAGPKHKYSFKNLLEAGYGVVVDLKQPYSQQRDFRGITHCFVDERMKELPHTDKAAMVKAGVHVVTLLYLQACVQDGSFPSVEAYAAK